MTVVPTDRELADAAWHEITLTTDSYPTWVKKGKPATSHFAKAKALLDQIDVAAPPPPPPPPGSPLIGISTGASPTPTDFSESQAVGAQAVRFDYSHSAADIAHAQDCHDRGMVPIMILFSKTGTMPGDAAAYWKGRLPSRRYELWNEPDLNGGWTPDTWAAWAAGVANQIKAADPQAEVWGPGIHKGGDDPSKRAQEWAKAIVAHKVKLDVFSVHYADDDPNWNNPLNGWHMTFPYGDFPAGYTVREILDANGYAYVKIASSESHAFYIEGAAGQAAKVTKFLNYVKSGKLYAVMIYRMTYSETGKWDSSLRDPNGARRPAWQAFRDFASS
jgi:hypothetical protein